MKYVEIHEQFMQDLGERLQKVHPTDSIDDEVMMILYSIVKDLISECLTEAGSSETVSNSLKESPFPYQLGVSSRLMHEFFAGSLSYYQEGYGPEYVDALFEVIDDLDFQSLSHLVLGVAKLRRIALQKVDQ